AGRSPPSRCRLRPHRTLPRRADRPLPADGTCSSRCSRNRSPRSPLPDRTPRADRGCRPRTRVRWPLPVRGRTPGPGRAGPAIPDARSRCGGARRWWAEGQPSATARAAHRWIAAFPTTAGTANSMPPVAETMTNNALAGANGHVGNNLCRLLLARGERVRAMIRASADPAALAGLDLEVVRGDIRDAEATGRAVAGCGRVYHTAAGFLMWSRDPERDIVAASVEGTRNVVGAAARAGVEKVLYV